MGDTCNRCDGHYESRTAPDRLNLDDARARLLSEETLAGLEEMVPSGHVHIGGALAMKFIAVARDAAALVEEVAQLRAAFAEVQTLASRTAEWDYRDCSASFFIGALRQALARAALSPAPRVNDRGRHQLEQIAALQERHALGQMSDADLAHAIKEICNVTKENS